jgi:hypothetical protein
MPQRANPIPSHPPMYKRVARETVLFLGVVMPLACVPAVAQQVILVNTAPANGSVSGMGIDRRYAQIEPTKVALPDGPLDARGHQDLLRTLYAEQGFAMRPLPRGKKGLTLVANGKMSPVGEGCVSEVTSQGLSVKAGDRVILSNMKIEKERIVFDINGGPDHKHEFLRHVQIGAGGPDMTQPVVQGNDKEPTGSRITLNFGKPLPNVTPAQVKALLAPLISFDVKSPVQAYTDTLPPKLKDAILNHHVMVGMTTDMVLFALGQPESKSREMEGQMPFEEWIYGHPPQDVDFVRVNGNRVIRVEIAKLGQPLEIFTTDEVNGLMTTDGKPVLADATEHKQRKIELGDSHPDLDRQAAEAPPTLRAPGEKLPSDTPGGQDPSRDRVGAMKPVIFPKDTTQQPARTVPAHPAPAAPADTVPDKAPDATTDLTKPNLTAPNSADPAVGQTPTQTPPRKPYSSKPDTAPSQPATGPSQFVVSTQPVPTA